MEEASVEIGEVWQLMSRCFAGAKITLIGCSSFILCRAHVPHHFIDWSSKTTSHLKKYLPYLASQQLETMSSKLR